MKTGKRMTSKQHHIYSKYQFHSDGRVWSPFKGGYFMRTTPKKSGYVSVTLRTDVNVYKTRFVHRLVFEAFKGPIPKGLEINHKNGIKHDNRLENLELVTKSENLKHAVNKLGFKPQNNLKIDSELKQLRKSAAQFLQDINWTQREIAKVLGVSQPQISQYLNQQ